MLLLFHLISVPPCPEESILLFFNDAASFSYLFNNFEAITSNLALFNVLYSYFPNGCHFPPPLLNDY